MKTYIIRLKGNDPIETLVAYEVIKLVRSLVILDEANNKKLKAQQDNIEIDLEVILGLSEKFAKTCSVCFGRIDTRKKERSFWIEPNGNYRHFVCKIKEVK